MSLNLAPRAGDAPDTEPALKDRAVAFGIHPDETLHVPLEVLAPDRCTKKKRKRNSRGERVELRNPETDAGSRSLSLGGGGRKNTFVH